MGEGVSKIRKNCRRRLWMVPIPAYAYKLVHFDRNINGNKDEKILGGNE